MQVAGSPVPTCTLSTTDRSLRRLHQGPRGMPRQDGIQVPRLVQRRQDGAEPVSQAGGELGERGRARVSFLLLTLGQPRLLVILHKLVSDSQRVDRTTRNREAAKERTKKKTEAWAKIDEEGKK